MLTEFLDYYCSIDGTNNNCFGHFLNDICRSKANALCDKVVIRNIPHVVFYAKTNIQAGDEIRYDYGVAGLEWRKVSTFISELIIFYITILFMFHYKSS